LELEVTQEVKQAMEEYEMPNVKTNLGTFSITQKEEWVYSEDYYAEEKKLKEEMKQKLEQIAEEEKEKGKAEKQVKESLMFRG